MSRKLTYKFIESQFKKEGYKLLENSYIHSTIKMKYKCPNDHIHFIRWGDWQQGHRCPYCADRPPIDINFIKEKFEEEGYKLLTEEYINSKQKLNYVCPKGHKHNISWNNWKKGFRCSHCSNKIKKTIRIIKQKFKKENYVLLTTEYKNNKQKLEYICPVGHIGYITWNNWKTGARCFKCSYVVRSGSIHYNWKGGISCEPYCDVWLDKDFKQSIKERDGYQCLNPNCWGTSKRLTIHHIDYNKKNCDPSNLITLCASCNVRANKDRKWHKSWYNAILNKRYGI